MGAINTLILNTAADWGVFRAQNLEVRSHETGERWSDASRTDREESVFPSPKSYPAVVAYRYVHAEGRHEIDYKITTARDLFH